VTLRRGSAPEAARGRGDRLTRVAELLRQELSMMMVSGMKDARIRFATVTQVRLSRDLRSARVLVSATGSDAERAAVVAALQHAEGYLRGQLGERLENLKSPPHLQFELDESIAYSVRIGAVLQELGTTPDDEGTHDDGGTHDGAAT
jgi:ribosome-binding factor A